MKHLVNSFEHLAIEYGRKTDNSIPTKTEIIELTAICKELFSLNKIETLKPLLYQNNPYVILLSASTLIKVFPEESVQKLEALRDYEPSLAGFEAKWILREWEDGNYKVPYER